MKKHLSEDSESKQKSGGRGKPALEDVICMRANFEFYFLFFPHGFALSVLPVAGL